jgi:dolichol-phosphate mannosyltransferase
MRTLVAIPVYNEQKYVARVLEQVRRYARDILVIDDGSTDQTPLILAGQPVEVIRHAANRGYGQSMIDAFRWAQCYRFDWLITMDCDEQHEPASLPDFYRTIQQNRTEVISGSRYLSPRGDDDLPPQDRQTINSTITAMVNEQLGLSLTDAFCGFKAYRVESLQHLQLDEPGYAFPIQFWVQAAARRLRVEEVPIRLIYNDSQRSFGGPLDNPRHRLSYYQHVFARELRKFPDRFKVTACGCGCSEPSPRRDMAHPPRFVADDVPRSTH